MRSTEIDEKIRALAARQLWLFNRKQACELGASYRMIARRLADGSWTHPEPSVYGIAGHPLTWRRALKASELGTAESAVAGFSAGALHRLPDFRSGRPEIVAPPGTSSRGKLAVVHREAGFLTTVVDGINVTTIAQTLFDVAPRVSLWRLERGIDDPLVSGALSVAELEERLAFYSGSRRHGLARVRPLIEERTAHGHVPPESELEAKLYGVLERLPSGIVVVRQPAWPWREHAPGRVDTFLPDLRLIVEGDSRRWHTRVADFERDRWRDNQAAAHHLHVMRFTWTHLTAMPADVLDLVHEYIRQENVA
jgi:very-short-patch-repair endonuclease